jgi:hypothetical protein
MRLGRSGTRCPLWNLLVIDHQVSFLVRLQHAGSIGMVLNALPSCC